MRWACAKWTLGHKEARLLGEGDMPGFPATLKVVSLLMGSCRFEMVSCKGHLIVAEDYRLGKATITVKFQNSAKQPCLSPLSEPLPDCFKNGLVLKNNVSQKIERVLMTLKRETRG